MYQAYDLLLRTAAELLPATGFDFRSKGAVSPREFMCSGDTLIARDRRWSWIADCSSSSMDCLSSDKQYLSARNIACIRTQPTDLESADDWLVCNGTKQMASSELFEADEDPDDRIYRYYDASITYDRYYETPRIWLIGYNKLGLPLKPEEMLEDAPPVYSGKTVTLLRHPYMPRMSMTVHPCCQTEAIKRESNRNNNTNSNNAILLALRIWASVLPSICLMNDDFKEGNIDNMT